MTTHTRAPKRAIDNSLITLALECENESRFPSQQHTATGHGQRNNFGLMSMRSHISHICRARSLHSVQHCTHFGRNGRVFSCHCIWKVLAHRRRPRAMLAGNDTSQRANKLASHQTSRTERDGTLNFIAPAICRSSRMEFADN